MDKMQRNKRKEDYDNSLFGTIHNWAADEPTQNDELMRLLKLYGMMP